MVGRKNQKNKISHKSNSENKKEMGKTSSIKDNKKLSFKDGDNSFKRNLRSKYKSYYKVSSRNVTDTAKSVGAIVTETNDSETDLIQSIDNLVTGSEKYDLDSNDILSISLVPTSFCFSYNNLHIQVSGSDDIRNIVSKDYPKQPQKTICCYGSKGILYSYTGDFVDKQHGNGKMVTYPFNDYISDVKLLPFDHSWLLFDSLEITGYWFDDYPNNVKITGFKDKDGNSITFSGKCHEKPFLSPGFFLPDSGILEQKNSQFSGSFKDFRKHGHGCESIQIFEENTLKPESKKMYIFNILDGKFDMGLKQGKFIQNVDETYEKVNYVDDQLLDDDLFSLDCNFDNLD